jgi:hypothetical protein
LVKAGNLTRGPYSQDDHAMDYARRSGSMKEDWPPNFGYKKRVAGEFSRVLAQTQIIPASRKRAS